MTGSAASDRWNTNRTKNIKSCALRSWLQRQSDRSDGFPLIGRIAWMSERSITGRPVTSVTSVGKLGNPNPRIRAQTLWQMQCPTCPTFAEPRVWQVWQKENIG